MLPRRPAAAAVLLALVGLLASCVSIPDSGPVHDGLGTAQETTTSKPRHLPNGPIKDAAPADIVRGYVNAMRAYPPDPRLVREFLTEGAASRWDPGAKTVVYSGFPQVTTRPGGEVSISVTTLGSLDRRGSWRSAGLDQQKLRRDLHLVQVDGQWRIDDPFPGLVIRQDFFEGYYHQYSLYFFDPTSRILVPDPVYLPVGDQTATLLVRGLVNGPTKWLNGELTSYVPASTDPGLSVPVSRRGIARVPLDPEVLSYGEEQRHLLGVQLAWTLQQIPEVRGIEAVSDGAALTLGENQSGDVLDVGTGAGFDPADIAAARGLFALRKGRLVTIVDGGVERFPGPAGTGGLGISEFAVDRDGRRVAAVLPGGRLAVNTPTDIGRGLVQWLDLTAVQRPQWDYFGLLWVVDETPQGQVLYTVTEQGAQPVDLGDGKNSPDEITHFSLSRDGMRMAVVDGTGADSRLLLGRVDRSTDPEVPLAITAWREIRAPRVKLTDLRDVGWSSPTELAIIARRGPARPQLLTIDIDGSQLISSSLADFEPVRLASTPTQEAPTVVASADGTLYVQDEDSWTPLVSESSDAPIRKPSYVE